MDGLSEALAWCERKAASERDKFLDDFRGDTERWTLERDDDEFLKLLTTAKTSGRAVLSNTYVHRAAQKARNLSSWKR